MLSLMGFAIMVGGAVLAASAGNSYSGSCLSPTSYSSYQTSFTRNGSVGTGRISLSGGKALCSATTLVLESFNVPSTWDRKNDNNTAVPQYEFAAVNVDIPAGKTNWSTSATVAAPLPCQNTQIDYYFPPAYPSIPYLHADTRVIGGSLFAGYGSCTPPPTPTPTPKPTPTPTNQPSPTPTVTPSPTPSPTLACNSLRANVMSGMAPFTVNFTGAATATGQSISLYQFDFGDNNQVSVPGATTAHTYTTPGSYTATLQVVATSGTTPVTEACSVPITVTGTNTTPTPTPPITRILPLLPPTGGAGVIMSIIGALLVTAGLFHIWITQRSKIIVAPKKR